MSIGNKRSQKTVSLDNTITKPTIHTVLSLKKNKTNAGHGGTHHLSIQEVWAGGSENEASLVSIASSGGTGAIGRI